MKVIAFSSHFNMVDYEIMFFADTFKWTQGIKQQIF